MVKRVDSFTVGHEVRSPLGLFSVRTHSCLTPVVLIQYVFQQHLCGITGDSVRVSTETSHGQHVIANADCQFDRIWNYLGDKLWTHS